MSDDSHAAPFEALPETLPVFPLAGALLLPRGRLPLNIFEPRYLRMVRDVIGGHRLIGMVQPLEGEANAARPEIYRVGCAGRISAFAEADQGRYLITLTGVCRFRVHDELTTATPYRQVVPDYAAFRGDVTPADEPGVDRERLLKALRAYLAVKGVEVEWRTIDGLDDDALVVSLAMACPFAPTEKQALLEAASIAERARALTALIEMGSLGALDGGDASTH